MKLKLQLDAAQRRPTAQCNPAPQQLPCAPTLRLRASRSCSASLGPLFRHTSTWHQDPRAPSQRLIKAHFQPSHSRDIEEITASEDFSSMESKRRGPVMIAVDNTPEARHALDWALDNLTYPDQACEQVHAVHVVCDPRIMTSTTAVGLGPGGNPLVLNEGPDITVSQAAREYAEKLLHSARLRTEEHCGPLLQAKGIPHKILVTPLPCPRSASMIGEMLLQEAEREQARALVIASRGPGALAEFGSVARYCYQHSSIPLVLIPTNLAFSGVASFDVDTSEGLSSVAVAASDLPLSEDRFEWLHRCRGGLPRTILLVVQHLPELEHHYQWVADNVCRPHDRLHIWHVDMGHHRGPSMDANLPSLTTALTQVFRERGLEDVRFTDQTAHDNPRDVAKMVCAEAEAEGGPDLIVMLNYSRKGTVLEELQGSIASELARHCPKPLVLLQPGM